MVFGYSPRMADDPNVRVHIIVRGEVLCGSQNVNGLVSVTPSGPLSLVTCMHCMDLDAENRVHRHRVAAFD
jgi:hypothetical protein